MSERRRHIVLEVGKRLKTTDAEVVVFDPNAGGDEFYLAAQIISGELNFPSTQRVERIIAEAGSMGIDEIVAQLNKKNPGYGDLVRDLLVSKSSERRRLRGR